MDNNSMEPMVWGIIGAVAMAAINTMGSVLMLWIRAKYQWREIANGEKPYVANSGSNLQPPK